MADREKVIRELKAARLFFEMGSNRADGVVGNLGCKSGMKYIDDALELLKEQEPIEPVDDGHGSLICGNQGYECGCVGRYDLTTKVVEKYCNFCPECGRKVKWNE